MKNIELAEKEKKEKVAARSLAGWVLESLFIRLLLLATLVGRFLTVPTFVEGGDGIFFVRGVVRYATYELRPHWPGYPVYIWLGKLLNLVSPNPVVALHILAVTAISFCLLPVAILAGEWRQALGGTFKEAQMAAGAAGFLWSVAPLTWLAGTEIYSDSLGCLLALTAFLFGWLAMTRPQNRYFLLIAAGLGGLLPGARLAYLPLLLPVVLVWWQKRATRQFWAALAIFGGVVASWLGWQLWQEGLRFFEAGAQHLSGHYSGWGGSITTDTHPLERPLRFVQVLNEYGWGGWGPGYGWERLPATAFWWLLLGWGSWQLFSAAQVSPELKSARWLVLLWVAPYSLWLLLAQDLTIARYHLPLVALGAILASVGLRVEQKISWTVVAGAVLAGAVVTGPLAWQHRANPPVAQQLSDFANQKLVGKAATSVIVVGHTVSYATFAHVYLAENSPQIKSAFADSAENTLRFLRDFEDEKGQLYLAWAGETPLPPGEWELVTIFRQNGATDSLTALNNALELKLYRQKPAA